MCVCNSQQQQQCDGRTCVALVHGVCRTCVSRAATALTPASRAACSRLSVVHALRPDAPTRPLSANPLSLAQHEKQNPCRASATRTASRACTWTPPRPLGDSARRGWSRADRGTHSSSSSSSSVLSVRPNESEWGVTAQLPSSEVGGGIAPARHPCMHFDVAHGRSCYQWPHTPPAAAPPPPTDRHVYASE